MKKIGRKERVRRVRGPGGVRELTRWIDDKREARLLDAVRCLSRKGSRREVRGEIEGTGWKKHKVIKKDEE